MPISIAHELENRPAPPDESVGLLRVVYLLQPSHELAQIRPHCNW